MSNIKELIKEIDSLKPIPQIAQQVIRLAEDPNSNMGEIADVITYDPMVTANLLKACNSAYFGLPRTVESVQEAVTLVGLEQIVDLVILKGGSENLKKQQQGYGHNEGDLWRQAVSCALIARELAEKKGVAQKQLIFTAALVKDIGKSVLDRFVADSYSKIEKLVEEKGYSFMEAEKAVIGINHAELGGFIAKKWKFSDKMTYIIQNHHMQDESAHGDLATAIVYLADMVCMMLGIGGGSDGLAYRFYRDILKNMEITELDLQEIIAGFGDKMKSVEELIQNV